MQVICTNTALCHFSTGKVSTGGVSSSGGGSQERGSPIVQRGFGSVSRSLYSVRFSCGCNLLVLTWQTKSSHVITTSRGTYLLLEKCKMVCYRNLFKRVYLIMEKHQIPLEQVARTFKWLGMPIDLDEVECILANLIFKNYVRGYISHAKRTLVLSKRDPFPTSAVIK